MTVATRTPAHHERRSARAAAWIALVAIVLAVADFVVLVVRHPLVVPFAIAAAAVVGAAGWVALTRSGFTRYVGLAVAVAAVVVAAALLISREALVEVIVAVGLVLIAL